MCKPSPPRGSRPFRLPNAQPPEEWLVRHDRSPVIVPDWPKSESLVMVVLYENGSDAAPATEAFVLLTESALKETATLDRNDNRRRLYFTVLRSALEGVSPGCTAGGD